ncbi:putative DNA primase/helicase [Paraburkholderia silvatlantica]|uniref:DNA primase/helicase n=1 Tax=Paraburkholderia silvatlantica TaxID=321895 RepID=A0ABR6FX50_9BURK|nr:putative DNA primase/helicase [Paraburkholderia silvatlantica]
MIPADDYETWVDMAFALKHGFGDEGFEIWDAWSRTAANYDERAARTTWRSASASGGKTLSTLFWHARQHGFDLRRAHYPDQMTAVLAPSAEVLAQRERDAARREARHAAVAREAASIWDWARPVGSAHPYLERKRLGPMDTLRELDALELRALLGYAPASEEEILTGRVLIVPVWNDGSMSTLELIDEQGLKSSLAGGVKKGGYWMTEPTLVPDGESSLILIAEGMATALSASRATGWFAVAALSSGNLSLVATNLRERYPDADLIVLGELGRGETQARQAAEDAGARVAWPRFAADARIDDKAPNDFSDMAVLSGFDAVGTHLREVVRSVVRTDGGPVPDAPAASGVTVVEVDRYEEGTEMSNVKEKLLPDDEGSPRRRSSKRGASKSDGPETPTTGEVPATVTSADPPATTSPDAAAPATTPPVTSPPRLPPSRPPVGEPLFGVGDVPGEIRALAEHRFGSPLKMGTPRENGGPYRGEVFNTEHYLIQEVATRSVVFHRKDQMTFVSERLKWMDENARLNGSELQVGYDGGHAKVYPWDRARDLLDRTVRSLKKSAQELNFSPNLEGMLDQLQARSWARIRELRTEALEKAKEHGAAREAGTEPDR